MDIKQKASLFAILSASALAVSKFFVGLVSGSLAVMSSGLDSLLDVFMSTMNLFAIRKAAKPADHEHQYGHGRTEDLAAVIQAAVIIATGGTIIYKAVEKFLRKGAIAYSSFDLEVMLLSLAFSIAISQVLKKVGKKTGSNTLMADALHYTSDLYSNSAAIVAIIVTYYTGMIYFDLLFSVIVGVIIVSSAHKILRRGLSGLMDTRIPEKTEREIREIIDKTPYPYAGYHKLRSRLAGSNKYVDFHLLICRKVHADEAHELATTVENKIKVNAKPIDVVIHIEPCSYECDLTEITCTVKIDGSYIKIPDNQSPQSTRFE
jgi:ferrous-iron efflux pump FieF